MTSLAPDIDVDEADIYVLSQGLEKSNKLALEINKSLRKISSTSSQSTQLFTPILSRNNMLITLQRNIESTLNSVASVKDLANEASKYEIILRRGIGKIGLKQYTQIMHKLDDMVEDIKSGKEPNAEFYGILTHLTDLIRQSENQLKLYFTAVINSLPDFDPMINMEKRIPFPYYNDQQLNELTWILDYFYNNSEGSLIETVFVHQRSEKIIKCMGFLEPFVKKITGAKGAPYEKGSNGMLNYTEALLGFIANERSLVNDLYSQYTALQPNVLISIITPLLKVYSKLFLTNITAVQDNLQNIGIYSFELVESVEKVIKALRFNKELEHHPLLRSCVDKVHSVTKSLYKDTVQRIVQRVNLLSSVPSDSGVSEPTVDTMSRLRKFSEYQTGCLNAMNGISREDWMVEPLTDKESTFNQGSLQNASNDALLSCFFSDCVDLLLVSLEKRAQMLLSQVEGGSGKNHKQRIGFFALMNITLVEEIVQKSNLNAIIAREGHTRLEKLKKRYIGYMVEDWRSLTAILMDSVHIDSTGKKTKDKELIKEKFRKFNAGFEELVSKAKQYRLNNDSLKQILKSEILSLVIPMYERFYSRYKDFFKNPRKHIKFTPGELTSTINQLVK
ncbi:GTP-Rho binding exocyst subunit EXO70 KNAG_0B01870 [Huiozyma naganishii CBS 8797]|uniref:Exocyst complex protein EXO70 n=1 Tax=Huiozyma naganishii (strain ATCC MYA-139 / BCRC 22969 / CBS 8797 / KCTC 17520 / NBRC 10181 / NCYC 3082 / Yp74L-3) TaxID=1071383 RepID=J7R1E6_HUIN7|nr:hypothetical protein KNAG_0B01870 [Kazachstania naganishii CBS 8797]CCK68630.1 hypothetical protein KNAG_0B01870 [Kazachstania naganishii CBS 8797]